MSRLSQRTVVLAALAALTAATPGALAAQRGRTQPQARTAYDSTLLKALQWRSIGIFRGGRSTAVAGHADQPMIYYFGGTGGGVWKTVDGGVNWTPMTDRTDMAGSIGAIAVAPSDPNVVYVGTGESPPRGNVSPGNGMWKSTDAGETWTRAGLNDGGQIAAIVVHPRDENLVYAAVLGHIFGPNEMRGVFRSRDGGRTWEKVLYRDQNTGAIDLVMDDHNSRVLYASLWQVRRMPHTMESGGAGSGIFKSTDGGDTWTEITRNPGLPKGVIGKVGIAVSHSRPERVWALVEAEDGGVYRSEDAGKTWRRVNEERRLRQRAWYYTHIHADPKDPETVYVMNTGFYRSVDGGRTYTGIQVPHGDNHALWIAPNDPERMINGNDGGANVSFNGGRTWTEQDQATAQFYHVTTTNDFPYQVCGAQQDNSTACTASRTTGFGIGREDWYTIGGCESGYIAVRPDDPNVSFAGCYGGQLDRFDRRTRTDRSIMVWPELPMGWGADSLKYRFQWTYPILFSPFDPKVLYVTSQHVHRSTNEGQSWQTISPDLTRNDKSRQGPSGGPITKDNTSVEYYNVVFALAPSPTERDVLWAGSDDGLVHVTRDGGQTWQNVTPRDLPEWALISIIDASAHAPGTAYMAATRYKSDDFAPYIYKTGDYGRTWTKIVSGIPASSFIRVVREDPARRGLLYAAGEFGIYVSFDDGANWQSLRLNLPVVPIHDMVVKDNDLVLATHGRSFWILDDLTTLHQLTDQVAQADFHLYKPRKTWRMDGGGGFSFPGTTVGQNPPNGVVVRYQLKQKPEGAVKLEFLTATDQVIDTFTSSGSDEAAPADPIEAFFGGGGRPRVSNDAGLNQFVFNMRYPGARRFPGLIMWAAGTQGPLAIPGTYKVRMTVGDWSQTQEFEYAQDPRIQVTHADLQAQFDLLAQIRDKTSETNDAVGRIRDIKTQLDGVVTRSQGHSSAQAIRQRADTLKMRLSAVEEELYQTKNQSNQDPLNFPVRLNNKIATLAGYVSAGYARPTDAHMEVFRELSARIQVQLDALRAIIDRDVPAFNEFLREQNVPALLVQEAGARRLVP